MIIHGINNNIYNKTSLTQVHDYVNYLLKDIENL